MNEYLKAQNKTNEAIMANLFHSDELTRFSKSDYRWTDNKTKPFWHKTIRKGEIYQFEFGKNYIPEMSYEHRGIVIGIKQKLLYVLPIFTYDPHKHPDVYHPIDNPSSKSDLFLLKDNEFSFISHDSVMKLNDIRTVSINRILYQQNGRILPTSETFYQIEKLVLQKYFPSFYYAFEQNLRTILTQKEQLNNAEEHNLAIKTENEQLKEELANLKKKLLSNSID